MFRLIFLVSQCIVDGNHIVLQRMSPAVKLVPPLKVKKMFFTYSTVINPNKNPNLRHLLANYTFPFELTAMIPQIYLRHHEFLRL